MRTVNLSIVIQQMLKKATYGTVSAVIVPPGAARDKVLCSMVKRDLINSVLMILRVKPVTYVLPTLMTDWFSLKIKQSISIAPYVCWRSLNVCSAAGRQWLEHTGGDCVLPNGRSEQRPLELSEFRHLLTRMREDRTYHKKIKRSDLYHYTAQNQIHRIYTSMYKIIQHLKVQFLSLFFIISNKHCI